MKWKRATIIAFISVCFLIVMLFGMNQYQENKQYQTYLSQKLVNHISVLSSYIAMNGNYLNKINENGHITREQLNFLQNNFENIVQNGGEVVELANWLGLVDSESHFANHQPASMALNFLTFLNHLEQEKMNREEILMLSSEQVGSFELINSVNEEWFSAITDNLEGVQDPKKSDSENRKGIVTDNYFEYYSEDMVNSKDWVEMIKQMQITTEQYEIDAESLFQ